MRQKLNQSFKSAVALNYDPSKGEAPRVTAKGRGLVAEKIVELAKQNDIPIQEDPDLVEVLSQIDLEQEIPSSVYKVVAELLAFIYEMNGEYKKQDNSK